MERGSTHEPAGEAGGGRTGAPAARQRATSPATAAVLIKRHLYLVQDSIRTDHFNHQNWPEDATVDIRVDVGSPRPQAGTHTGESRAPRTRLQELAFTPACEIPTWVWSNLRARTLNTRKESRRKLAFPSHALPFSSSYTLCELYFPHIPQLLSIFLCPKLFPWKRCLICTQHLD